MKISLKKPQLFMEILLKNAIRFYSKEVVFLLKEMLHNQAPLCVTGSREYPYIPKTNK